MSPNFPNNYYSNSWTKLDIIRQIRFLKTPSFLNRLPSLSFPIGMPRTGHPNASYDPCGCFATVEGMLPYPPKEASGRRVEMPATIMNTDL